MKTLRKIGGKTIGLKVAFAATLAVAFLLYPDSGGASDSSEEPLPVSSDTRVEAVAVVDERQPETDVETEPAESEPADPADAWGIEVTSIRLTANNHMIDFRYRVLDAAKAGELFVRQNKPVLVHQETGKVLAVPETAKTGPLRNSNNPQQGRIYWMFFGNAGNLVKAGDPVTIVIGAFRVENLEVE